MYQAPTGRGPEGCGTVHVSGSGPSEWLEALPLRLVELGSEPVIMHDHADLLLDRVRARQRNASPA